MKRKRYELAFDPDFDKGHIATIEDRRRTGSSVVDTVRTALAALDHAESMSVDHVALDDLRDEIAALTERITVLENARAVADLQNMVAQIARKMDTLEDRIDGIKGGEVGIEVPTELDIDEGKQAALSATLKKISFGSLNH